jgi:hypothetical protein
VQAEGRSTVDTIMAGDENSEKDFGIKPERAVAVTAS